MRLLVEHDTDGGLKLPINYHHILQSIIYASLDTDSAYGKLIHDRENRDENRAYKFFNFSLIKGKYQVSGKNIVFPERVHYEIRSIYPEFIDMLAKNMEKNGIRYGDKIIKDVTLKKEDRTVEEKDITVRMLSPVTVHRTDMESKKTYFPSPEEELFKELVRDNFHRKYAAYSGSPPDSEIEIIPLKVNSRDKYVTNYKDFYISGWWGIYRLKGERKYLDFLYQTGLGNRNSQGFGMFEVMEED